MIVMYCWWLSCGERLCSCMRMRCVSWRKCCGVVRRVDFRWRRRCGCVCRRLRGCSVRCLGWSSCVFGWRKSCCGCVRSMGCRFRSGRE